MTSEALRRVYMPIAALACAVMLASCGATSVLAPSPAPVPVTVSSSPSAHIWDERALAAAEIAYNVPAQAYVTANRAGQLSPALKARAKPLLVQAYGALKNARRAKSLVEFTENIRIVNLFASQAKAILPSH